MHQRTARVDLVPGSKGDLRAGMTDCRAGRATGQSQAWLSQAWLLIIIQVSKGQEETTRRLLREGWEPQCSLFIRQLLATT